MNELLELYAISTIQDGINWAEILDRQMCPYLQRVCGKTRKSTPNITIGSCSVTYGKENRRIIICPHRLLERGQIFLDCIHLLTLHEPGNELHVVPEVTIPGGSVDYFLASVRDDRVIDFVGVELQTLDTTGTVWPARQRFLQEQGITGISREADPAKSFGMNWKMTAKTILMQLNHKIQTFENVNKHLALVLQDYLLTYMQQAFQFEHVGDARLGDSMQFHAYMLAQAENVSFRLKLAERLSTDAAGVAACLGLQADPNVTLARIVKILREKISPETLLSPVLG